jgi:hypothetical protein
MLETNVILKIVSFTYLEPSITVELTMPGRHDALDIADKLNDIAKAKKEDTTRILYRLLSCQIATEIVMTMCHFNIGTI